MILVDGGGYVPANPSGTAVPTPPPATSDQLPRGPASLDAPDLTPEARQRRLADAAPYFGGDRPTWRQGDAMPPQPSPGPAPTPPAPTPEATAPAPDPGDRGAAMAPVLGAAAVAVAADGPLPVGDVIAGLIVIGGLIAVASAAEGGGDVPAAPVREPAPTPVPEAGDMPEPASLTDAEKRDWVTDPDNLRGRTPEEIESMIPDGWTRAPSREGDGVRYANPERPGEQVRVQQPPEHLPPGADPTKAGPYARVSRDGQVSDPIPLDGNPTLPK